MIGGNTFCPGIPRMDGPPDAIMCIASFWKGALAERFGVAALQAGVREGRGDLSVATY